MWNDWLARWKAMLRWRKKACMSPTLGQVTHNMSMSPMSTIPYLHSTSWKKIIFLPIIWPNSTSWYLIDGLKNHKLGYYRLILCEYACASDYNHFITTPCGLLDCTYCGMNVSYLIILNYDDKLTNNNSLLVNYTFCLWNPCKKSLSIATCCAPVSVLYY